MWLLSIVLIVIVVKIIKASKSDLTDDAEIKYGSVYSADNTNSTYQQEQVTYNYYDSQYNIGYNVYAEILVNSPFMQYYPFFMTLRRDYPFYDLNNYKMLLWSLYHGRIIEANGYYILESIKADFPYLCETKYEYDLIQQIYNCSVFEGNLMYSIRSLQKVYGDVNSPLYHPDKLLFWKKVLVSMSEVNYDDDFYQRSAFGKHINSKSKRLYGLYFEAYEAIVSVADNEDYMFSALEKSKIIEAFKEKCINDYVTARVEAYSLKLDRVDEKIKKFEEIIDKYMKTIAGGSDIYCYLVNLYNKKLTSFTNQMIPNEDKTDIINKKVECVKKGAEINDGLYAGKLQRELATYYLVGFNNIPKDINQAIRFLMKARNNGIDISEVVRRYNLVLDDINGFSGDFSFFGYVQ